MDQPAQQIDIPLPPPLPPRYPPFINASAAISDFRAYKIKNMSRDDQENEKVAQDYVTRGIFVPKTLITRMLLWDRTPTPNLQLRQDDKDCVALIEAYIEHHGGASTIRRFFRELEMFPEIDIDYRLAKMILAEADERQISTGRLECFTQAVLNIYRRRELGDPKLDGSIKMRYICISLTTLLAPLLPKTTLQTIHLLLGSGGFLIRSTISVPEITFVAVSWGKYMRIQIYRYIISLENLKVERAHEQGDELLEALNEMLEREVRRRGELHKVVWNLGWGMEKVRIFWEGVREGVEERVEEWNAPVGEAGTSWFVKVKNDEESE